MGRGLSNRQARSVAKGLEAHRKHTEERARKAAGMPVHTRQERRPRGDSEEGWKDWEEWELEE